MAISTMDELVSALAGGQKLDFYKVSATAEGAATWHSLLNVGSIPAVGSTPANLSGIVCTDSTSGAFKGLTWSNTSYLGQLVVAGATAGKLIVYDRLWHNAGMAGDTSASGTIGIALTVCNTLDITRPTSGGASVEIWGEIYNPVGATATNFYVIYENQDGVSGRLASYAHPANAESLGQMFPFILQAGDTGVRRIAKYFISGTTATTGNWGITLLRRIAEIPLMTINVGYSMDFAELGLPRIYDNACLAFMVMCTTTNTGIMQGSMKVVQG